MLRRTVLSAVLGLVLTGAAFAQEATAPAPTAVPPPAQPAAPPAPRVTLTTTMGTIVVTLDSVGAPKTTAHMLRLFRLQHYVGAGIFRIEPGFLIQLGSQRGDLSYIPLPPHTGPVPLETATTRHQRGAVALAHGDDPNSGNSSWYFDLAANDSLNAKPDAAPNTTGYAVFGQVTEGMDVLDRIATVPLDPTRGPFPGKLPKTPIVITAVKVE